MITLRDVIDANPAVLDMPIGVLTDGGVYRAADIGIYKVASLYVTDESPKMVVKQVPDQTVLIFGWVGDFEVPSQFEECQPVWTLSTCGILPRDIESNGD
jgi:hypothetical protein